MSLQYSPKIVTDSLVMCLDASNNKSYPTDLPVKGGLVLWLDAADDTTFSYSSGTVVSQWRDKSGLNNHTSQATVLNQPSRSTAQNSRKIVTFDGTNDSLSTSNSLDLSVTHTIFAIASQTTGTEDAGLVSINNSLNNGLTLHNGSTYYGYYGDGSKYATSAITTSTSYIFTKVFKGTSSTTRQVYLNGTSATTTGVIANSDASGVIRLGQQSTYLNGTIAEVIIFNRELTATELKQVHTYLGQKWGISNTDRQIFDLSGNNFNFSFNGTNPRYNAKTIVSNFNTTTPYAVGSFGGQNLTSTILNLLYVDHTIEVAVNLKGFKAVKSFDNARDYEGAAGIVLWQGYHSGLYVDAATQKLTYLIWNATPDYVATEYVLPNDLKDKILYITAKRQANVLSLFINGALVAGPTSITTTVRSYTQINIGAAYQGDPSSGGSLGAFVWAGQHEYHLLRMYSRALATSELVSNYQAFKARFDNNIVRFGLVLDLDAGNPSSYAGAGTVWYDVSGNGYNAGMNNITPSNWVTYNGVKAFETNDTNNQNFTVGSFPFPQSGRTYEIWINSKSFSLGWQTWFDDGGGERVLFGTSTNTMHVYPSVEVSANLVVGQWYQLLYTMVGGNGTAVVVYKDGQSIGSGTYGYVINSGTGILLILGDTGSEITSCYCSTVRVYNRVLSAAEVLQNYNATKGRFGL